MTNTPNPEALQRKILVAEDDPTALLLERKVLEKAGFQVLTAKDGLEAISKIKKTQDLSLVLLDLAMPNADGFQCLNFLKNEFPELPVIIVSGAGVDAAVMAVKEGAYWFIPKPIEPEKLLSVIQKAIGHEKSISWYRLEQNLEASSVFLGNSLPAKKCLEQTKRIAALDSTVLITGESGTGKSTLAQLIHGLSKRTRGPFVSISCAAVPRDLFEAELFGHERGAFTGAVSLRRGIVEVADGGTLFLDEIGDLPLELQPKLLTFIEERSFQRLGSNKVSKVNIRVIAATLQNLEQMCLEKRFREDLYFRLRVLSLHIPPLRERKEDIPVLVEKTLKDISVKQGISRLRITESAMEALMEYRWSGNVRELQNVLEQASLFARTSLITLADLPIADKGVKKTNEEALDAFAGKTLQEVEEHAVREALRSAMGNKAKAARKLGISERSIYNIIKRLNLTN